MGAGKISSAAQELGKQGKEHKLERKVQIQLESRGEVRGMEGKGLKLSIKGPSKDSSQVQTDRSLPNSSRYLFAPQQIDACFDEVYAAQRRMGD